MPTIRPMRAGNKQVIRQSVTQPYGLNVSSAPTGFSNGCLRRMPFAVSRSLMSDNGMAAKDFRFTVTHPELRLASNGGQVQTGFDFQFELATGANPANIIPMVTVSYDGVNGTLNGYFKQQFLFPTQATKGFLYYNNSSWGASRDDIGGTFPLSQCMPFLPSVTDHSLANLPLVASSPAPGTGTGLDPGATFNGSTQWYQRNAGEVIGQFLWSALVTNEAGNVDKTLWCYGISGPNTTPFFIRRCGVGVDAKKISCWRMGWTTDLTENSSYYETGDNTAATGNEPQHLVLRRFITGGHPLFYVNGEIIPWVSVNINNVQDPPTAQKQPITTAGNTLFIGRGAVSNRHWQGTIDAFKFYNGYSGPVDWAACEYSCVTDPVGSVVFGTPEGTTPASIWGETVYADCDAAGSVTVDAAQWALSEAGAAVVDTVAGSIVNPAHGTLTKQAGTQVKYTNDGTAGFETSGSVRLVNPAGGKVIIPTRFNVTGSPPPPPSGYYKVPNHLIPGKTKTPVNVSTVNELKQAIADFKSGAHSYSSVTHFINIDSNLGSRATKGGDIVVNTGGTKAHPLVITCTNGDKGNNWSGRPIIYNNPLIATIPWVWFFGLYCDIIPTGHLQWNTTSGDATCFYIKATDCFVTACRGNASRFCYNDNGIANGDRLQLNYNWFEAAISANVGGNNGDATAGPPADAFFRCTQGGAGNKCIQGLTMMYNYGVDSTDGLSGGSKNFRFGIIGNGTGGQTLPSVGTEVGWNFINCSVSHCFEFKCIPDYVHHNHCTGVGTPTAGFNIRGPSADGPRTGKRPLFLANRFVNCNNNKFDCGFSDYVSNWLVDGSGNPSGTWDLYAAATRVSGKEIAGADGINLIDTRADVYLGENDFEPDQYTYGNLGSRADVFIERGNQSSATYRDQTGAVVGWTGDPGTMSGSHPNVLEAKIHYKSAISSTWTPETPPILTAALVGPGLTGKTWDQ